MNKVLKHHPRPPALFLVLYAMVFTMAPNVIAQHTIDFSKSTNLKAIYDSGLRPWRIRPDEARALKVTDQQIRVVAPGTRPFTLDVQIGNFPVRAGNELNVAEFISQPMSLTEAAAKAREVCQALNINTAQGAGMGGLEEKISQLVTLGDDTPAPQYWNGRSESDGVRYSVTLDPLFGINETRGKVYVVLNFQQPSKPMKPLAEPIKPPPGYEHMSMERPDTDPTKPFPDPEYSRDNMIRLMEEMKGSASPTIPSNPPLVTQSKPVPLARSTSSVPWSWIGGAILVLAVVGGILLKMYPRATR